MDSRSAVSLLATVATLALFLTSGRTALDIRQRKQTGDVRLFPFLAAAVNCGLWTGYGLLQGVLTVVVVNGVGFVLSSIYIGVFYVYAKEKAAVQAWILNSCGLVVFVALYMWLLDPATRVLHMGVLCACTSTLMFGSPLVALDASSMSLMLSAMNLVVSSLWALYGYMLWDMFILLPNAIGGLLAVVQVLLILLYPGALPNITVDPASPRERRGPQTVMEYKV